MKFSVKDPPSKFNKLKPGQTIWAFPHDFYQGQYQRFEEPREGILNEVSYYHFDQAERESDYDGHTMDEGKIQGFNVNLGNKCINMLGIIYTTKKSAYEEYKKRLLKKKQKAERDLKSLGKRIQEIDVKLTEVDNVIDEKEDSKC